MRATMTRPFDRFATTIAMAYQKQTNKSAPIARAA